MRLKDLLFSSLRTLKKGALAATTLLLASQVVQAQAPNWQAVSTYSSTSTTTTYPTILRSVPDANGNLILAGTFQGSVTFGNITLTAAGSNSDDVFVAKYNPTTDTYSWAERLGSTFYDQLGGLAVNGTSIYVSGSAGVSHTAATFTIGTQGSISGMSGDTYVVKLTDTGTAATYVWNQVVTGANDNGASALAVSGNNVYVAGRYSGATTFGTLSIPANVQGTAYVAKIVDGGSSGSWLLAKPITAIVRDMAVNGTSVYLTGYLQFYGYFDNFSFNVSSTYGYSYDSFVAKMTDNGATGTFDWAVSDRSSYTTIIGNALVVRNGSVYLGASIDGSDTGFSNPGGRTSGLIWKMSEATGATSWRAVWIMNSYSSTFTTGISDIDVVGSTVFVTGNFNTNSAELGSVSVTNSSGTATNSNTYDGFVGNITDQGTTYTANWAQGLGGAGYDITTTMSVVGNQVCVAGTLTPPAQFSSIIITNSTNNQRAYIARLQGTAAPAATTVSPQSGAVGSTVTISGTGLTGATTVSFNGVAASSFTVNTNGTITTTVPAGATAGYVTVTTPSGTATSSSSFCVQYQATTPAVSRCGTGTAQLVASGAPSGGTYAFYTSATGGSALASGSTFTTPMLTSSTTYYVGISTGSGADACEGPRTAVAVTVNAAPTVSVAASGATTLCAGGSVVLTASGASSYLWSNGATTPSITVTQGGTYSVTGTSATGCSGTSAATTVAISPAAIASITTSGPTTFCQGSSVVLTANGLAGSTFTWSTGATTPTLTVTQGGNYTVTATTTAGCQATSAATTVSVNATPTAPTITQATLANGAVRLTSSVATGVQWYLNGVAITGATSQTYTVLSGAGNGSYTAVVTSAAGCASPASAALAVTVLGTRLPTWAAQVQLYPNPTEGQVTIELPALARLATVQILNTLGQEVIPATKSRTLNLSQLARGVYVVRVQLADETVTKRLTLE